MCSMLGIKPTVAQTNPTQSVKLGTSTTTAAYADESITDGVTNSNAGMTLSFWVYPTLTGHDNSQFALITLPNADGGNASLFVGIRDNGNLRVYRQVPQIEGADFDPLVSNAFPTANTWYHVLLSNTKNQAFKCYINGVEKTGLSSTSNNNWRFDNLIGIRVGCISSTAFIAKGDQIAQLWLDNADADIATNLSKFYNNGFVNMGSDGTASGLSRPLIYHTGNTTSSPAFHTSGGRTSASSGNYITYNLLDNDFGTIANGS